MKSRRRRGHGDPLPMRAVLAAAVTLGLLGAMATKAAASPPDPALLSRLEHDEQDIEHTGRHMSYRAEQVVEELDGDGKVSSKKTMRYRVESNGTTQHRIVEKATEDGRDVTAAEQEKVREKEATRDKKKDDEPVWPFAPDSQAHYTYDQIRVDPANPAFVEIAFAPRKPDGQTFEGKAWVDTASARILSASVRMSKPPGFVDWVHLTAEFSASPAGPTLNHLTFEGAGGILFIRKHFRGEVTMSGWHAAP